MDPPARRSAPPASAADVSAWHPSHNDTIRTGGSNPAQELGYKVYHHGSPSHSAQLAGMDAPAAPPGQRAPDVRRSSPRNTRTMPFSLARITAGPSPGRVPVPSTTLLKRGRPINKGSISPCAFQYFLHLMPCHSFPDQVKAFPVNPMPRSREPKHGQANRYNRGEQPQRQQQTFRIASPLQRVNESLDGVLGLASPAPVSELRYAKTPTRPRPGSLKFDSSSHGLMLQDLPRPPSPGFHPDLETPALLSPGRVQPSSAFPHSMLSRLCSPT